MRDECGPAFEACADTPCSCDDFGDTKGQINCLLACPTITPAKEDVDDCAAKCGFGSLMQSHPTLGKLMECLVNAPGGPPNCPECFGNP